MVLALARQHTSSTGAQQHNAAVGDAAQAARWGLKVALELTLRAAPDAAALLDLPAMQAHLGKLTESLENLHEELRQARKVEMSTLDALVRGHP